MLPTAFLVFAVGACSDTDAAAAACDEWQGKVHAAYLDAQGGALSHINVISDTDIAKSVPGRPDGCAIPPSEDNTL
jgi:hypothetical protein